jgi:hypothetical protein
MIRRLSQPTWPSLPPDPFNARSNRHRSESNGRGARAGRAGSVGAPILKIEDIQFCTKMFFSMP